MQNVFFRYGHGYPDKPAQYAIAYPASSEALLPKQQKRYFYIKCTGISRINIFQQFKDGMGENKNNLKQDKLTTKSIF